MNYREDNLETIHFKRNVCSWIILQSKLIIFHYVVMICTSKSLLTQESDNQYHLRNLILVIPFNEKIKDLNVDI